MFKSISDFSQFITEESNRKSGSDFCEEMEDSIALFSKTLASFCKNLQTSCDALKESVERRPIPLDSASSTFIQCLNRRVSSASADLNLLESMSFGTVSFEELLGHCNEVYKKNQSDFIQLEDRFKSFGYVPEMEIDDGYDMLDASTPIGFDSKYLNSEDGLDLPSFSSVPFSATKSIMKRLEADPLFEESLSLQNLGISDACLATLSSQANGKISMLETSLQNPMNYDDGELHQMKGLKQPATKLLGQVGEDPKSVGGSSKTQINISQDDYENLPSYMRSLASWEDLHAAVEKMNVTLSKQEKPKDGNLFYKDELESLGLGSKGRSYLLLLLRMNRLVVETIDGSIAYRVL